MNNQVEAVRLAEEFVDLRFFNVPLPHGIRDVSVWHILTAMEDLVRFAFIKEVDLESFVIDDMTDELKYSLKYCLSRVWKESVPYTSFPLPERTVGDVYKKSSTMIISGLEYKRMVDVFSLHHGGHLFLRPDSGKIIAEVIDGYETAYSVLERFRHGKEELGGPASFLYGMLSEQFGDEIFNSLLEKTFKIEKGRVKYFYNPFPVMRLTEVMQQAAILIPDDFEFRWGSQVETLALINSLQIRCCYHLLCVNLAVKKYKMRGGFDSSLVLVISREELITDVERLAEIGRKNVENFVGSLTYGVGTSNPDPSLQPLIPAKNGMLLLPCSHIVTCNMQRNLLSLMTRVDSKFFNSQSSKFEVSMIDKLWISSEGYASRYKNRNIKGEEVDFIIVDEVEKIVLMLELRWMIQPGDPREVSNRIDACKEKVSQIKRKIRAFEDDIAGSISSLIGRRVDGDGWKFCGVVVIEGYGGAASLDPSIPIITFDILCTGLREIKKLKLLHEWILSLIWLPKINKHFEKTQDVVVNVGAVNMQLPGLSLVGDIKGYLNYVRESAANFQGFSIVNDNAE